MVENWVGSSSPVSTTSSSLIMATRSTQYHMRARMVAVAVLIPTSRSRRISSWRWKLANGTSNESVDDCATGRNHHRRQFLYHVHQVPMIFHLSDLTTLAYQVLHYLHTYTVRTIPITITARRRRSLWHSFAMMETVSVRCHHLLRFPTRPIWRHIHRYPSPYLAHLLLKPSHLTMTIVNHRLLPLSIIFH